MENAEQANRNLRVYVIPKQKEKKRNQFEDFFFIVQDIMGCIQTNSVLG